VKLGVGSEPLSNLQGPYRRPYILGRLATLPLQLEKKVEEKFQSIRCEVPVFVKVMTTTNVHATSHSPCEMVRLHTLFFYTCKYGRGSLVCTPSISFMERE
jgi:hypothetical protein